MFFGSRFAAGLLAILSLVPESAYGQQSNPPTQSAQQPQPDEAKKQQAKQFYEEGVSAYRAGHYSEAIDKLLEADRVMPNAAFSYNIALTYQAMGDKRSALRWLRGYLRQSAAKDDESVLEKVRNLEAELQAKGLQQVTVLSQPAGATLRIDGNALGITPFTTEIAPGSHQVTLTLEGYKVGQRSFELRADRSMDVDVLLEPDKPVASAPSETIHSGTAPPSPASSQPLPNTLPLDSLRPSHSVRLVTWISLGMGAALAGGSVYFELARESAEQDAKNASQRDYASAYDRMKSRQTVARVLVAGSAIAFTAGFVLLTVDLTRSGPLKTASVQGCGSGGLCTSLEGHF